LHLERAAAMDELPDEHPRSAPVAARPGSGLPPYLSRNRVPTGRLHVAVLAHIEYDAQPGDLLPGTGHVDHRERGADLCRAVHRGRDAVHRGRPRYVRRLLKRQPPLAELEDFRGWDLRRHRDVPGTIGF